MVYPTDEETFNTRNTPEFIKEGHLNSIQAFLKRIQDFLGYGGRISDKYGVIVPPGVVFPYTGETAPAGFLLCNGQYYNSVAAGYTDLFAVIGYKYGQQLSTYYNVPDTRGAFLRGWGVTQPVDVLAAEVAVVTNDFFEVGNPFGRSAIPVRVTTTGGLPAPLLINTTYYVIVRNSQKFGLATTRANAITRTYIDITTQGTGTHTFTPYWEDDMSSRLATAPGGNTGEDLGSWQADAFQGHHHAGTTNAHEIAGGTKINAGNDYTNTGSTINVSDPQSDPTHGTPKTAHESRPKNLYINHIIKR